MRSNSDEHYGVCRRRDWISNGNNFSQQAVANLCKKSECKFVVNFCKFFRGSAQKDQVWCVECRRGIASVAMASPIQSKHLEDTEIILTTLGTELAASSQSDQWDEYTSAAMEAFVMLWLACFDWCGVERDAATWDSRF